MFVFRPRAWVNFVIVQVQYIPLHFRPAICPRLQSSKLAGAPIDQKSVIRNVAGNFNTGRQEGFSPFRLYRPHKLNQVKRLPAPMTTLREVSLARRLYLLHRY